MNFVSIEDLKTLKAVIIRLDVKQEQLYETSSTWNTSISQTPSNEALLGHNDTTKKQNYDDTEN